MSSSQVIEVGRGGCVHFFGSIPAAWNHLHHKFCRRTTSFLYRRRSISVLLHCLAFQLDSASTCKTFYREILLQTSASPMSSWEDKPKRVRRWTWSLASLQQFGNRYLSKANTGPVCRTDISSWNFMFIEFVDFEKSVEVLKTSPKSSCIQLYEAL